MNADLRAVVLDLIGTLAVVGVMFAAGALILCGIDVAITGTATGRCALLF